MKYLVSSYYLTAGTSESIAGITKSSRALSVRSGKYLSHSPAKLAGLPHCQCSWHLLGAADTFQLSKRPCLRQHVWLNSMEILQDPQLVHGGSPPLRWQVFPAGGEREGGQWYSKSLKQNPPGCFPDPQWGSPLTGWVTALWYEGLTKWRLGQVWGH